MREDPGLGWKAWRSVGKKEEEGLASFWLWGWPKEEVEAMEVCREATGEGPEVRGERNVGNRLVREGRPEVRKEE